MNPLSPEHLHLLRCLIAYVRLHGDAHCQFDHVDEISHEFGIPLDWVRKLFEDVNMRADAWADRADALLRQSLS